jgi:hypothetical protein
MPDWSSQAMTDMSDLITKFNNTADAVATLRNKINQWATPDGWPRNQGLGRFSGDGLNSPVDVVLTNNTVMSVKPSPF